MIKYMIEQTQLYANNYHGKLWFRLRCFALVAVSKCLFSGIFLLPSNDERHYAGLRTKYDGNLVGIWKRTYRCDNTMSRILIIIYNKVMHKYINVTLLVY